eukprot:gene45982-61474_t
MTKAYDLAKDAFAEWGVDTETALAALARIAISVHCWQGDDVGGFERKSGTSGGGIQATGNHPGRARTPDELRADLDFAFGNIPGTHRLNLHACYLDSTETPDRDQIEYRHFTPWVDWAKDRGLGLDFNPTFFGHAKADDNLTLSHPDAGIREFWVEHGRRSRDIAARIGAELGSQCVNNIWVPDGYKDIPIDRMAARQRLWASLDAMLAPAHDPATLLDAAGVPPHPDYPLDGVSLLPLLHEPTLALARPMHWRMSHRQQRALRDGDWKYLSVDGHERASAYSRPNQRGPRIQGWRNTGTNQNLNRDFLKLDQPEMRA